MGQADSPINLDPFSEASAEALTRRNRFIDSQVTRNRNGLTRGRKRHRKHRRALAIRKLLQMATPPIFIDPQGDSDLLKKMLRAGQAQGRKDDFCQLVFAPAGAGMSFFRNFIFKGKKIKVIDVGPTHLGITDLLARNGMVK